MKLLKRIIFLFLLVEVFVNPLLSDTNVKKLSRRGKNVLLLHSYNSTYIWSEEITRGLKDVIESEKGLVVNLYLEYLDAKRYPGDEFMEKMHEIIEKKYKDISEFDIIVAADNQALIFMMRYGDKIFPNLPVVFCGINYLEHFDLSGYKNYTGIAETIRPDYTINQIINLQPEVRKIKLISDCNTKTGIAAIQQTRKLIRDKYPQLEIEYPMNGTMTDLLKELSELDDEYAVLLLIYNMDEKGNYFDVDEAAGMITSASKVPVYVCWDFYLGHGVIGGAMTSGYEQGEAAGQYIIQLLKGKSISEFEIIHELPVKYVFDWEVMQSFNLHPSNLRGTVRLVNEKTSYLKQNWRWILIFLIVIGAMAFYILSLLLTQKKLKKSRGELRKKDIEWTKLAESLPGLVFRMDLEGRFIYINSYLQDLLRISPEEMIGKTIRELNIEKRISRMNENAYLRAIKTGEAQKVEFNYNSDSTMYAFETNIQPEFDNEGKIVSLLGIVYDLTERFQVELQLQESERKATEARKIAHLGFWEYNISKDEFSWSSEISEILNVKHEPDKQSIELLCHIVGIPLSNLMDVLNKKISDRDLHFDKVHSLSDNTGVDKWVHERGEIIIDKAGNPVSIYGTVQDISKEKAAEQQIRSSESKFRTIFDNAPMGISLTDRKHNFIYYNPAQLEMSGYDAEELKNLRIIDLIFSQDRKHFHKRYEELFEGETGVFSIRKRIIRKDGSLLWTLATVASLHSEEAQTDYALTMEIDISEQMLAEQKVYESQQLLEQAQKIAGFGYWKYEPWHDQIICSGEMLHILGYDYKGTNRINKAEFVGYFLERDKVQFEESLTYCLKEKSSKELAVELVNRNKKELQANVRMLTQETEDEEITILGTFIDITLMKSIEFKLKRSEERFRLFFENSPLGVILLYENEKIEMVNPAAERLFKISKNDFYKKQIIELLHEGERAKFISDLSSIKSKEKSLTEEYLVKRFPNNLFWCSLTMAVLESQASGRQGVILLIEDINEQKLAREKLRESEEKYRSVFEVSQDGLFLTDMDTSRILDVNRAGAEIFGYTQDELLEKKIEDLVFDKKKIKKLIDANVGLIFGEKGQKKSGELFPMEVYLNYFTREYRNYHYAAIRNISERIKYEEDIRNSEKKFRTIVENAPLGVIFVDRAGRNRFNNDLIRNMFSVDKTKDIFNLDDLIGRENQENYRFILEEIFQGSRMQYLDEKSLFRHDGTDFYARMLISLVRTESNKPDYAIIMIQDITDQKDAEQKVFLYEKLQSIGQLAGMIAHDFNNQLMGILGYSSILQEELNDEKLNYYASMINTSAERSAALTRKLLSFARKGKHIAMNLDFHKLIKETISMISTTIQPKIAIKLQLEAKQTIISGDPNQLQNAILNLILNACDAMESGGELNVSTANCELKEEDSDRFFENVERGMYLEIIVSDSGHGIDDSIKEKIFDPFFTTKRDGKGTGLGLPAVFGTMKSHQGYLSFESEIDKGTSFYLYFHLADVQVEEKLPEKISRKGYRGSGKIMVVDDEEIVRKSVKDMLSSSGFEVEIFSNGEDGISYFKENWNHIDLILLDVIMPGLEGPDVYLKLKEIQNDVKVLLFSAYSSTREVQVALENGVLGFIRKPVLREELSQKIAQAIALSNDTAQESISSLDENENVEINKKFIHNQNEFIAKQLKEIASQVCLAVDTENQKLFSKLLKLLEVFLSKFQNTEINETLNEMKNAPFEDKKTVKKMIAKIQELFLKEVY